MARGKNYPKRGKGRGKPQNAKSNFRDSEEPRSTRDASQPQGDNDVSWYTRYPNLVIAAASLPYPYRPGMSIDLGSVQPTFGSTSQTAYSIKQTIPGVMSLAWAPTVGKSKAAIDPASLLGMEIYAKVRQAYSGTLRADAPDYVIYIMALDSVYSYIAWLKRLYRVLTAWTPENYALPEALLHGMGLMDTDITQLRQHRMQLWEMINQLVLESRKFTCPGSLDIINRHYWMNDNVYVDDPTLNSQMYIFNQAYYLEYYLDDYAGDGTQVGGLRAMSMPWLRTTTDESIRSKTIQVSDLYSVGHGMLESLAGWDDSYTINGYLQRAYGDTPLFVVDELPMSVPFSPVFSTEVLSQIENSRTVLMGDQLGVTMPSFDIYQNPKTNAIISNPSITLTDVAIASVDPMGTLRLSDAPCFLSSRSANPNPLENVVMTRLHAASHVDITGTNAKATIKVTYDVGTEIPLVWTLVGYGKESDYSDPATRSMLANLQSDAYRQLASTINLDRFVSIVGKVSQFDWHPYMIVAGSSSADSDNNAAIFGDIHNVTVVNKDILSNIHQKCLFSEFNSFSMS